MTTAPAQKKLLRRAASFKVTGFCHAAVFPHYPINQRSGLCVHEAIYSPLPGGGLIFVCFSTLLCSSFSFSASSSVSQTQACLIASSSSESHCCFGSIRTKVDHRSQAPNAFQRTLHRFQPIQNLKGLLAPSLSKVN